jgi:hypothetical protein
MWLSGVNRVLGASRGHALNYARQQQSASMKEASRVMLEFWLGPARPKDPIRKRRSKRR